MAVYYIVVYYSIKRKCFLPSAGRPPSGALTFGGDAWTLFDGGFPKPIGNNRLAKPPGAGDRGPPGKLLGIPLLCPMGPPPPI